MHIGIQLDNGKAPCTVNNFASLAQQGFFDSTTCHRLTTSPQLGVLQCGDPSGDRHRRAGLPVPQRVPHQPVPARRSRAEDAGDLSARHAGDGQLGPGTNGSQFFLVYDDSMLPPTYTVFGTIDATGLATLDKVAAAGVAGASEDGKPRWTSTIDSVRLD